MSTTAASRRGFACRAPLSAQRDTHELLLHNLSALQEVENCGSLVLQELVQHQHFLHPTLLHTSSPSLHAATPTPAASGNAEKQDLSALQQAAHSHYLHPRLHDSQRSCTCEEHHLHSMEHAEAYPHPDDQLPSHDSSVSLLHRCSALNSSGFMCSGELLDHLAINSEGLALPALCSKQPPSRKSSVSDLKRAQRASFRRAAKKSPTFSAQFSSSEHGIIGPPCNERRGAASMCAQAKKGIPANHFVTERQRREFLNEKYQVLRSLIPNPTKADRASIVQDAIDHVNDLKERVEKLQLEVASQGSKRRRVVDDGMARNEGEGAARSCDTQWTLSNGGEGRPQGKMCIQAQMTSKYGTGFDVRVMGNEATIKVTHDQSQESFLLLTVRMLQEAHLELLHANGARICNQDVYMLNVKIAEGNDAGAAQIAKQLLDRFDTYHDSSTTCC